MHVSIVMVRALTGAVERAGASREQFLRAVGIDPRELEDGTMRLEVGDYVRALEAALAISGDPALGLHMGELSRSSMFDVIGPLAEQAATLRENIDTVVRYSRLLAEGHEPELHEAEDTAAIRFPTLRGELPAVRFTAELVMAAFLPVLQLFAGPRARPSEVRFAFAEPPYAAEYDRIFAGAQRFGRDFTELVVPRAWLDVAQPYRDPELRSLLEEQAERKLGRLARDASLEDRIERILADQGSRALTMQDVARRLEISERSLRRRLQAEGVSYAELVTRSRTSMAKRLLQRPGTSIQQTAHEMGFATAAAFHRAFKRWTGMTPKDYQDSF